ncbi:protein FAM111A-like [Astyanax mexicanus]|nr:protein FAM111A-like [Astyanax mexicanus]
MHTGGFIADDKKKHAIGFAIPLQSIIKNIIKQLDSRESLDAMFRFIEAAAQNPHLEEYLKEFAESLMRNPSDENAEMLVKICFETKRNGMLNLFQMIQEKLDKNKKYFEQILQKIDRYRAHQEEE